MRERTALVTGGNRGIGLEVCRQLGARGLRVILSARDPKLGTEAAAALAGEGLDVRVIPMDVGEEDSVAAAAEKIAETGLVVDVLVNNAGVYPQRGVLDMTSQDLRKAFEVNFFGAVRTCRAFVPGMVARGYGRVVNVSSQDGQMSAGLPGPAPYAMSKAAMNALTVRLAAEVGGDVLVNSVCPGWVHTRMGGPAAPRTPEEGAAGITWLATLPAGGPTGSFFVDRRRLDW